MSGKQPVEVLLRPAVELYTVVACAGAAFLSLVAPWSLALSPSMGVGSALAGARALRERAAGLQGEILTLPHGGIDGGFRIELHLKEKS